MAATQVVTLAEVWELYSELNLSEATERERITETGRWNHYLDPEFGSTPLEDIRTIDVLRFRKKLEKLKLSPQTVYHCLSLLRILLRKAQTYEIYEGKLPNFIMPRFDNRRQRFLTQTEAQRLLKELQEKSPLWHDITLFALQTGLRASEIFQLRKSHVSFDNQLLYVFDGKNRVTRSLPLTPTALEILRKRLPSSPEAFFFTYEGRPIKQAGKPFRQIVEQCFNTGVTDRRNRVVFHTLRHTFASWLVQSDTPLTVVGALLGHKTHIMTQRYAHLSLSQVQRAVSNLPTLTGVGK